MSILCLGEIMLRLSPESGIRLSATHNFQSWVGGAEANVACALGTLGYSTGVASVLPNSALGMLALGEIKRCGVDVRNIALASGRMGLYFLEKGSGNRSAQIVYDRAGSAFAGSAGDLSLWYEALEGYKLLHLSGITLALSDQWQRKILAIMAAAKDRGMTISFDCNFRPSLWEARGADPVAPLKEALALADIVFGNHRDFSLILGWDSDKEGEARRREAAQLALDRFPNIGLIASTARHVIDDRNHAMSGRIDHRGGFVSTPERTITGIVDRIGTGDAFVAGILAGYVEASAFPDMLDRAMAMLELKHGIAGDVAHVSREDIDAILRGTSDVRR